MGQFASRAFDGDPYIDILRSLPDKELVWWVQKVVWLAEGFTVLEHFGRTYPRLFMHKCPACNGAGTVTCPHCNGYKIRRAHSHAFRLSEHTTVGRLLASADLEECNACGTYCPWDNESDWQEEWNKWESRLSYYDRTQGPLFDEWYEDVINEGRLDEDTQPEEEPQPLPGDNSIMAQTSRDVAKDKQRLKALMRRVGGHPYEHSHMLPYGIVDPSRPLSDNLQAIGYYRFDLPPDLHPEKFPDLLLEGPNGALQQFDRQIQAEYLIMNNLDAALRDQPKPAQFRPTAGTVACPHCQGQAWRAAFAPNLARMLGVEQPFWARTFASMQPYWSHYSLTEGSSRYSPWMAAKLAVEQPDAAQEAAAPPLSRRLDELPTQPPLVTQQQAQMAEKALPRGKLPSIPAEVLAATGAARPNGEVDYGALAARAAASLPSSPSYLRDFHTRDVPNAPEAAGLAAQLLPLPDLVSSRYGPKDPLSRDPEEAFSAAMYNQQVMQAPGGPILKDSALTAQFKVADVLNPAREGARILRDARQLGKAETPEEQELMAKWAAMQPSLRSG